MHPKQIIHMFLYFLYVSLSLFISRTRISRLIIHSDFSNFTDYKHSSGGNFVADFFYLDPKFLFYVIKHRTFWSFFFNLFF